MKMKSKLFFFPSEPLVGYRNPYCNYYKEALNNYYEVLDMNRSGKCKRMFTLLLNSFRCKYIVFNWLESVPFFPFGKVQFVLALMALFVLKLRKVKVLFMFHDLIPHFGDNWMSRYLMKWLFTNSDLIITHSKEALDIAKKKSEKPCYYICHPVYKTKVEPFEASRQVDVFIWGAIYDYKGIYEFISLPAIQSSKLQIYILGHSMDERLKDRILSKCNSHIVYEDRRAGFSEIAAYCKKSKYVLFPYVGESISSSGALVDTLVFGGVPIGPNRGAFKDLAEENACLVYNNYEELCKILHDTSTIAPEDRKIFLDRYSWENFAKMIYEKFH